MNAQEKRNYNFLRAARKMDTMMLKRMITSGVDIEAKNQDGKTALMLAAQFGYAGIVKILMNLGANTATRDNEGYTARELAQAWNRQQVLAII